MSGFGAFLEGKKWEFRANENSEYGSPPLSHC
jgi:hypothetical protein